MENERQGFAPYWLTWALRDDKESGRIVDEFVAKIPSHFVSRLFVINRHTKKEYQAGDRYMIAHTPTWLPSGASRICAFPSSAGIRTTDAKTWTHPYWTVPRRHLDSSASRRLAKRRGIKKRKSGNPPFSIRHPSNLNPKEDGYGWKNEPLRKSPAVRDFLIDGILYLFDNVFCGKAILFVELAWLS
jgi:hypothetical protein